jgi:histidine ammonia-lyase
MPPLVLEAKEGLALINGTQTSTALALHGCCASRPVHGLVIGALTLDAARGSGGPSTRASTRCAASRARSTWRPSTAAAGRQRDPRLAQRRRRAGAGPVLPALPAPGDGRLPGPGPPRRAVLVREANAVTDNPLVFEDVMISGGNFHAEPVALAADNLALAIAEVARSPSAASPC